MSDVIERAQFRAIIKRSSRRKTSAITIRDAEVTVLAPKRMKRDVIERFVDEKQHWIIKHLQQLPAIPTLNFVSGDQLLFKGQLITLKIVESNNAEIMLTNTVLQIYLPAPLNTPALIKKKCTLFMKKQAQQHLPQRFSVLANEYGFSAKSLEVKSYTARWGSCGHDHAIQLNWKLIFAPLGVIDYVIIHELCHTHHFNHSPQFWRLVASFCPDYKQSIAWLKAHGYLLRRW